MAFEYPQSAGQVATALRKPGAIVQAVERIEKATAAIFDHGRVLQDIGDRVIGTRPKSVSPEKPAVPASCELNRLEAAVQMLEMAAGFIQDEAHRFENL